MKLQLCIGCLVGIHIVHTRTRHQTQSIPPIFERPDLIPSSFESAAFAASASTPPLDWPQSTALSNQSFSSFFSSSFFSSSFFSSSFFSSSFLSSSFAPSFGGGG